MNPINLSQKAARFRTLVVDDHPLIRQALRNALNQSGDFEIVAEVGSVAEAFALAATTKPAIAIVDLRLPDGDGLDLIVQLLDAQPDLRVLVFSSLDDRLNAAQVRKAGAHGFVSKLRGAQELLGSLRLVMAGYTCFASERCEPAGSELSRREASVLHQLIRGQSNVEIAASLNVSPKTVSTYKTRLMQKLELENMVGLVEYAKKNGL